MHKRYVYKSVIMHIAFVMLCAIDISFFNKKTELDELPPIIVDLENLEITDTTNLPEKAELGEEDKVATRKETNNNEAMKNEQPKEVISEEKKEEPKIEEEIKAPALIEEKPKFEEKTEEPKKESNEPKKEKKKPAPIPQKKPQVKPEKKPEPKKKTEPKKEPKKQEKPQTPSKTKEKTIKRANPLAGMGSTLNDLRKQVAEKDALAQVKSSSNVSNLGVEGGNQGGSYFSKLTISGVDFVRAKIQERWKTLAGGKDDRNIEVVIVVKLTQDGVIQSVKIKDSARYRSDTYFQALADSAERAIYIAQDTDNVFVKLAQQNASSYNDWKEIIFTFTPLGGVW